MKNFGRWILAVLTIALFGCGGSGGGTTVQGGQPAAIRGTAAAGIIYPGSVKVFAVSPTGAKGALLAGPVPTSIDGTYSASLGSYSGAILVEASGTYTDEATGHSVSIAPAKPLHAMVEVVDNSTHNNRTVAVTPLTELAWRKASGNGSAPTTPAAMTSANHLVDDLFKISDVVGIEPVRADNASMANASQEAQAYTLALSAFSTMCSTAAGATDLDKLESGLSSMETEVAGAETNGSMSTTAISDFQNALAALPLSTDFSAARDQFATVGKKSQTLTLSIAGTLPTGTRIHSVQGNLVLPVNTANNLLGVSFLTDSTGQVLAKQFEFTDAALAAGGTTSLANFQAPQGMLSFSLVFNASATGFGTGDIATLSYEVVNGATVTAADFALAAGSVKITDVNGVDITGVSLVLK
ncbi:hypothetical protein [Geomonas silvestris]|uniref:hypothetical protein n=1 Tax=Geomonas silvestris TaxID=2740184 RepID=UPI001608D1E6|nr:hypothetical protein [Geomonas silvestris]